ncbi:MAG: metallophosphoesterase [Candidatus Heimdallarchaeaceae archaeon]
MKGRKKIIFLFLALLMSSSSTIPWMSLSFADSIPDTFARNVHLSWKNNTSSTIVISWRTNVIAPSIVEYGKTSDYKNKVNGTEGIYHHVELTNLEPDTVYHYRIYNGIKEHEWTKDFTFKTGNNGDYARFVAWGDSRSLRDDRRKVIETVYYMQSDFSVFTGDLVESGKERCQWYDWFADFYPLISNNPFMPILGNHEKNHSNYYNMFELPEKEEYYSFDYGSVHFSALHTCAPYYGGTFDEQVTWLENDLSQVEEGKWKVVLMHRPPFSSGSRYHNGEYQDVNETFVPIFEKYNVDLVFTGHEHFYERLEKNNITYVITGGAGAPIYKVVDDYKIPESIYSEAVNHATIIRATPNQIDFQAVRTDYSIMDSFTINKINGVDLRIDNVQTLKQVLVNETVSFDISISNIGTENLNESIMVEFTNPFGEKTTETIDKLEVGKTKKFTLSFTPTELKTYDWTIKVENSSSEISSKNNEITLTFLSAEEIKSLGIEPNYKVPQSEVEKTNWGLYIGIIIGGLIVVTSITFLIIKKVKKT